MSTVPKLKNNKKIKQKRRRIALFVIVILFGLVLYFIFRAKDYEKNYRINEFEIKETYDKKLKYYSFEIKKENKIWHFVNQEKYQNKKKLIKNIEYKEMDNTACIITTSEQLTTYPQCIEADIQIDFHLVKEEMKEQLGQNYFKKIETTKESYEKITISHMDDKTYFIWNYKGFYMINKKEKKSIPIFQKDIYDLKLVNLVDDILLIPDYNEPHYFNKFYFLHTKTGKLTSWEFKDNLYIDGYFLGVKDKSIYFVDKKNQLEWEISPSRKKMRKVGTSTKDGKIYENGWQKISVNKLINETKRFTFDSVYHYEIENGLSVRYLNCQSKKKISNKNVKEIVSVIKDTVYYLVDDSLYSFQEEKGEILIMNYFEWNFNYKNMIFITE